MESPRRIGGSRALLPYEAELCNALGISEKEYFEFIDLAEAAIYQREKGYEHIPDIRAGAVLVPALMSAGMGATAAAITSQIIIGVALTAISYLLTPKPKTPETPPQLTVGGVQGRSRFTPQSSFDSIQDLAVLGSFIPLVYARRIDSKGGVRVNSQLLWSHMKTTGIGEILSVVTLFSNGQLGSKPSFDSFALGTTMLQDFSKRKLALYFTKGRQVLNRINTDDDRYIDETTAPDKHNLVNRGEEEFDTADPFSVRIKSGGGARPTFTFNKGFSSVETQSSKSKFGAFAPISNGNAYKVPWELVMFPKGIKDEVRNDSLQKLQKITHKYPRYSALIGGSEGQISTVNEDTELTYRIYGASSEAAWESEGSGTSDNILHNKFAPWGSKDAKSAADTSRIEADERLRIGQQYLIGTALATCTLETNGNIWDSHNAFTKDYKLTIDESGYIQYQTTDSVKDPFDSLIIQKVAIGAVSNTRKCNYTEIGIKSKVFRRMNGAPNVNAMVSRSKVAEYESKNGSISIGSVNKYITRFSFFRFQMKLQEAENSEFQNVLGSTILGIEGNSPLEQYNTICVKNDEKMYDYRFVPVPGNYLLTSKSSETVYILGHNNTSKTITYTNFSPSVVIDFNGNRLNVQDTRYNRIAKTRLGNPEWVRGGLGEGTIDPNDPTTSPVGGQVVGLTNSNGDPYSNNTSKPTEGEEYVTQTDGSDNPPNFLGNGEYYNRQNGVVAIRFKGGSIREGFDSWGMIYGGTEIPSAVYVEGPASRPPTGDDSWVTVEDAQGQRRKFKLGRFIEVDSTGHELWSLNKQILLPVDVSITTFITNTIVVSKAPGGEDRVPQGLKLWVVLYLKANSDGTQEIYYEWTIRTPGEQYVTGDKIRFYLAETYDRGVIADQVLAEEPPDDSDGESGSGDNAISNNYWSIVNTNPNNAIADYYLYDSEDSSHSSQPEHEIVFVNEIKDDNGIRCNYPDLAMAGLRIHSTQEITSLSNLSAFITDGIKTQRLINDSGNTVSETVSKQSTNNFVEIAYDLLTNDVYGAAELIGARGVNRSEMIDAAKYCYKNEFTWDGVIDKRFNLREFIFEHAAYNLLDFSIKGGQFSLRPSFPVKSDFTINYQATSNAGGGIDIKALFSDGNMRNLQVSFLSPEEREMFKATVLYREDKSTSFPETKVKTYAYDYDNIPQAELKKLPEEVFDLSNWNTSKEQAHLFAAVALATRKEVDHGITFETTPTSVLGVLPGDYIRVISEVTHTSRFNNGSVDKDGFVTSRIAISGTINVYYWKPGNLGQVQSGLLSVGSDGKVQQGSLIGTLFAQIDTTTEDRLYKIESLTYGEEGFIKVAASHAPLTSDNKLAVLYRAEAPANLTTYFPELGA